MYVNITDLFDRLLEQAHSIDIAEAEFKKQLHDDDELHEAYREWCQEMGYSEKNGFFDYCEEYKNSQDDIWESLNDFDE